MTRKGELTKEKILQAAVGLFSTKSFANVTVRKIAKEADVSPALLYKYFEDQEELYFASMKMASREFISMLSPISSIEELVKVYLQHMFMSEVLFGMMTHFMIDREQPNRQIPITADVEELLKLIEENIPSDFARVEAQLLFSTMNGLLISYKKIPNRTPEEALASIQKLAAYYVEQLQKRLNA